MEQPKRKFTRVSPFLIFVFAVLGVAAVKMTMQQTNIETPLAEISVGGPQCIVKEGDDTGIAPGTDTGDAITAANTPITVGAHQYELKPNFCLRKPHKTWAAQIMMGKRLGKQGAKYDFMVKAWDGTQAGNVEGLILKSTWLNEIPPNDQFGFERMGETSTASVTNAKFVGGQATVYITTKADGKTLQDALPTPCDRKPYTQNVLAAIAALGEKGIFHLDLQAHNWMVNKETKKVFIIDWKTAIRFTSETNYDLGAPKKGDPTYDETLAKLKGHYADWANKFGMGPVTKDNINTMFTKTKLQEWSLKFAQNGMLWRSLTDEKYDGPKDQAPPIPTEDPTITECPSA